MAKIHIGRKIKEVLDNKKDLTVTEFAKKISITRDGAYKIFEKEAIASDQLGKICKVLGHDFFSYYQNQLNVVSENTEKYGFASKNELEELTKLVGVLAKEMEKMRKEVSQLSATKEKKKKGKK